MHFHVLPVVPEKSEFTLDYSLQVTIVVCLYVSMEKYVFATCGLSLWLYTWLMGTRDPWSINVWCSE